MNARAKGTLGEDAAAQWLISQGARLLARNYRTRRGEIDIIAEFEGYVAFVEVKARATGRMGAPGEAVTPAKCRKIILCAQEYMQENDLWDKKVRFDVIELTPGRVNYIPFAFDASGM